eukprot:1115429_1
MARQDTEKLTEEVIDRLRGFRLEMYNNGTVVYTYNDTSEGGLFPAEIEIGSDPEHFGGLPHIFGDKVKISLPNKRTYLHLKEVVVKGFRSIDNILQHPTSDSS